jgi:hypothetical protein
MLAQKSAKVPPVRHVTIVHMHVEYWLPTSVNRNTDTGWHSRGHFGNIEWGCQDGGKGVGIGEYVTTG